MAGTFLAVDSGVSPPSILAIGVTGDLSRARSVLGHDLPETVEVYVRLNVSRALRRAEHDDLTAAHPDVRTIDDDQ